MTLTKNHMETPLPGSSFEIHGPTKPACPVVLSVPHAGRRFPDNLLTLVKPPHYRLAALEDRHADALIATATRQGATALVSHIPRLVIDLNRSALDVDPAMTVEPVAHMTPLSAKARGGLGLIPRQTAVLGELWTQRLTATDVAYRIEHYHRPYHAALAAILRATRDRFGTAILVDVHSMPPLPKERGRPTAQFVFGDRFGRSANQRFIDIAAGVTRALGYTVAVNIPYAGNYLIEHHGRTAEGVHALQVEVDRSLYLDTWLMEPGRGLPKVQQTILRLVEALSLEVLASTEAIAAE
jgi:N-formylglutamate amidohydrolase